MGRGLCPHSPPLSTLLNIYCLFQSSPLSILFPTYRFFLSYQIFNQVKNLLCLIQYTTFFYSLSYPVSDHLLLFVLSSLLVVLSSIRPSFTLCPIQYPTFFYSLSYLVSDLLLLFVLSSI